MIRVYFLIFVISILQINSCDSVELKCEFKNVYWNVLDSTYYCYVDKREEIITERLDRTIRTVSGSHLASNTNNNVKGVNIYSSEVVYFPLGIEKFFIHLEAIKIHHSNLKEIRKYDLKAFRGLKFLGLVGNDLKVIEENLFANNPNLEGIDLRNNKISHIDANVFNGFENKLSGLWLSHNICSAEDAEDDKQKVNAIIAKVRTEICKNEMKLNQFLYEASDVSRVMGGKLSWTAILVPFLILKFAY